MPRAFGVQSVDFKTQVFARKFKRASHFNFSIRAWGWGGGLRIVERAFEQGVCLP